MHKLRNAKFDNPRGRSSVSELFAHSVHHSPNNIEREHQTLISNSFLFLLLQGSQHPENEPDVFRYLPSEQVGRTTAGDMRTLCKSSANGCLQSARENHTVAATSSDEQLQKCSCSHYRMRSHPVKLRAQFAQLRQQRPLASELLQALEVMGLRHCWIRQGPRTLRHDVKTADDKV